MILVSYPHLLCEPQCCAQLLHELFHDNACILLGFSGYRNERPPLLSYRCCMLLYDAVQNVDFMKKSLGVSTLVSITRERILPCRLRNASEYTEPGRATEPPNSRPLAPQCAEQDSRHSPRWPGLSKSDSNHQSRSSDSSVPPM